MVQYAIRHFPFAIHCEMHLKRPPLSELLALDSNLTRSNVLLLFYVFCFSIWDLNDPGLVANFEDARPLASNSWALDHVDYFVDCHYSTVDNRLWVICGINGDSLGYFPVVYGGGMRSILSPKAVLHGGHTGVVKSVLPSSPNMKAGINQTHGIFGWSGGEDGGLCC